VLLGTGNPLPDPDRSGPATAVVVNGTPYLVDMGVGLVRRAKAAVIDKGSPPWSPRTSQLAELASQARPRLLILHHASMVLRPAVDPRRSSPGDLLGEISSRYQRPVVVGRDLDVY
jgi:ribonuclease BN (tRNA processing enzyme)